MEQKTILVVQVQNMNDEHAIQRQQWRVLVPRQQKLQSVDRHRLLGAHDDRILMSELSADDLKWSDVRVGVELRQNENQVKVHLIERWNREN